MCACVCLYERLSTCVRSFVIGVGIRVCIMCNRPVYMCVL